ncbi:Rhodanese-like domain-containing protein [Desulforhopalus singaporensis]|uniref:Rhodanese-like domain-containing protein n=3 Tax=Desulforhopalus singaporensis TaxID=91360 RepID=A0A1H0SQX1_9BACT|nr:Rhodanese-like domain-containing protein [Desulforhopalus singaporensis]
MKWKQFLTPVASISNNQARELAKESGDSHKVVYLDVRQPKEYEQEHLPGAKLIPLGELDRRLSELDREKTIIVY